MGVYTISLQHIQSLDFTLLDSSSILTNQNHRFLNYIIHLLTNSWFSYLDVKCQPNEYIITLEGFGKLVVGSELM
jgi:hypothetical protein